MGREDLLPPASAGSGDQTIAGRYRLERSLGNGGMGDVFVATDTVLNRRVAIKRLSSALAADEPARARFFREARALARINDPNVVAVFDAGGDTAPYLVMELIDGTTLRSELRKSGRVDPERARSIGAGIASGLAAAHAQGVIHRDIKPSNIFLTTSGEPKVGDFGIARIERGDLTLTIAGQAFGSPAYVSPEQAMGGPVDARTDLYSLGCVLYEMLAGRRPFAGADPVALTYQHLHTVPARLDALDARVAPQTAALVEAMLAKDPADRPRSADEVRRALEAPVPGEETAAAPLVERDETAVLPRRAQTLATRRRPPWWLVAGAAGVLVVSLFAIASALRGDAPSTGPQASSSAGASSASTSSPSVTSAPTSVQSVPATPEAAGAALVALAQQMEAGGLIDKHLADEVGHTVSDVLAHMDEPDESAAALADLQGRVADDLDHGKIASADAQRLMDAIATFARSLPGAGGGNGNGGNGQGD
jgi:serine/threonine protein kinase